MQAGDLQVGQKFRRLEVDQPPAENYSGIPATNDPNTVYNVLELLPCDIPGDKFKVSPVVVAEGKPNPTKFEIVATEKVELVN